MPKMKSHRGLAKRVKKTASGKLKRSRAYTMERDVDLMLCLPLQGRFLLLRFLVQRNGAQRHDR